MLALFVLMQIIDSNIPKSSKPIHLVTVIRGHFITGTLITLYTLIACPFAMALQLVGIDAKLHKITSNRLSTVRLLDLAVGVAATIALIIQDSIYFALMRS